MLLTALSKLSLARKSILSVSLEGDAEKAQTSPSKCCELHQSFPLFAHEGNDILSATGRDTVFPSCSHSAERRAVGFGQGVGLGSCVAVFFSTQDHTIICKTFSRDKCTDWEAKAVKYRVPHPNNLISAFFAICSCTGYLIHLTVVLFHCVINCKPNNLFWFVHQLCRFAILFLLALTPFCVRSSVLDLRCHHLIKCLLTCTTYLKVGVIFLSQMYYLFQSICSH